jgi:phosphotransacetylase
MKGSLHTDTLMHAVLQHDSGLRTLRRVSHAFVLDTEAYPRPMMITDAAINIVPSLDDKVDINLPQLATEGRSLRARAKGGSPSR